MIIVVIIFVFFLGVAVGLGLHFPLTRELRKAFDVAVEGKRAADARVAAIEKTLGTIKAMLHRSRAHRNFEFGGPVALPIAAESTGQQSAKTTQFREPSRNGGSHL